MRSEDDAAPGGFAVQEPLFLLVLMVMTALGVRVFLGQIHGTPLRLPRLRLPHPGLPRLPGRRRTRRSTRRTARTQYGQEDDAGAFAPARSPFSTAAAPAPGRNLLQSPAPEQDEEAGDGYEEAYVPASRVDFFAADEEQDAVTPANHAAFAPAGGQEPVTGTDSPGLDAEQPQAEASPVYEVAAATEPDPNDIMSFFEKPAATTQLPEALRETMEDVSAAQLLAEARQLRSLLRRESA